MRKRGRHISAAIFSTMLLFPLLAMLLLQLGKAYIQSTREERLETEDLVTVVLPSEKVVWEEEGRELWVGDQMFDVASYTILDGNYHLTGVYDDDETEVAGSLLHLLLSGNNAGFLQFLLLLQSFAGSILLLYFSVAFFVRKKKVIFLQPTLLSPIHLVLGPPPRRRHLF
ncbi:MAG: hypothetical protein EOO14_26305 [Chitinophagaceae bacterium]|nr:MAG: hypothetical protein EOO14_26305 [Chitinophagaceae bacterium]